MKSDYQATVGSKKWPQCLVIFGICLTMMSNGIHYGWTSPTVPKLLSNSSEIRITSTEASTIYVVQPLGHLIGCPGGALIVDYIGPKWLLMSTAIPQLIAWLMIGFANQANMIIIARILAGFGESFLYISVGMYVGESVEPKVRGILGGLPITFGVIGILIINIFGAYYPLRWVAFVACSLPILLVSIFIWMPDSPYHLLAKNKRDAAYQSLQRLRGVKNVDKEFESITIAVTKQNLNPGSFLQLITVKSNRKAMMIMIGLRLFQQASGPAVFTFYTVIIFQQTGIQIPPKLSAIIYTALQSTMFLFFTPLLDKFGRKPLFIISAIGTSIFLTLTGTYFYLKENEVCGAVNLQWMPGVGMIGYVIMYCFGFGLIPTLMLGELFSANIKPKAICVNTIFYAISSSFLARLFQTMVFEFGMFLPFYVYSGCSLIALFFAFYFVPETKGKSLEDIQKWMRDGKNIYNK